MNNLKELLVSLGNINENQTLRRIKENMFTPLAMLLINLKMRPTPINLIGLVFGLMAAILIGLGDFPLAFVAFTVSGLADALDGTVARALKMENDFGVFFDSVCDRYVDTAVFLGIAWYYMSNADELYVLLTFATVIGTVVTSYSRARAESLSLSSRYVGFLNRPERVILLLIGLIFPSTLRVITWILAILSNVTATQRILFYSNEARRRNREIT